MPDPVWLADVLTGVGLPVDIYDGAYESGHGDMPGIQWGLVWHHTGATGTPGPGAIARHPELGLASQLYLGRSGRYTVCGVGIAWHAGRGSWPGIPTNDANRVTIGIEAENSGTEGWSPEQYGAYVLGSAAILRKLGHGSDRMIGHREWFHGKPIDTDAARKAGGKWDPGYIDLPIARAHIADALAQLAAGRTVPTVGRYRVNSRTVNGGIDTGGSMTDRQLLQEIWDQLRGPSGKGWPQLGGKTPVDTLADISAKLDALAARLDRNEAGK